MDAESIRDLFEELAPISIRRMFGCQGIFRDGLMFALEDEGEIFIKTDDQTAPLFADAGSRCFTYARGKIKAVSMNYWRLPDSALDDPSEAARWARYGVEAARRGKKTNSSTGKRKDTRRAYTIETTPDELFEKKAAVEAYERDAED